MKTITVNTYTAQELKDEYPQGFERAHQEYKDSCYDMGVAWGDEIMDSLKAVFEKTDGLSLKDWSIDGSGGYSWLKMEFNQDEAEDLSGARAQAWIENNLLYKLRIPYTGEERKRLSQYGAYYRPGMIEPCPFTGVCFDEDFLDSLRNDIKAGCTIGEAYRNLAQVAARLFESEWDNQLSEEYFLDIADGNEWSFDEDGRLI